jgi:hypothetical protein
MKYLRCSLSFIFFILNFSFSNSQPYDPSKINKKAVQLYSQAMERTQDGNLTLAAGLLLQCVNLDKKLPGCLSITRRCIWAIEKL